MTKNNSNNNPVIAAKICGTYETYMDILRAKQNWKLQGIDENSYKKVRLC